MHRPTLLVLRPGALGDTILTYPALGALRRAQPGHEIVVFGHRPALDLARPDYLDQARSFDEPGLAALFAPEGGPPSGLMLSAGSLDLAVLWLGEAGSAVADRLRSWGVRQVLVADPRPPDGVCRHIVDHLLDTLAPLEVAAADPAPRLHLADERRQRGADLLRGLLPLGAGPAVALHAGSGGQSKCWPAGRFAELCDLLSGDLGVSVVLLCGPADEEPTGLVLRQIRGRAPAVAAGLALDDVAALLSQCAAFVGNDSGLSHLAAALDVPTVALYGPTDPEVWGVRGRTTVWLKGRPSGGLCIRPCVECGVPGECLSNLRAQQVLDALSRLLGAGSDCRADAGGGQATS